MTPTEFTPLAATAGGLLIGLAAVLLMATTGRIAGVSGYVSRLLPPYLDDQTGARLAFVAGLLTVPLLGSVASGIAPPLPGAGTAMLVAAGLLVGFGSVLGGGCTSGHGVCGTARFSKRSLVATGVFMAVAISTVYVIRHVIGG